MHNLFQYGFFVCLFVGAVCLFVFNYYLFCFVFWLLFFLLFKKSFLYFSVRGLLTEHSTEESGSVSLLLPIRY